MLLGFHTYRLGSIINEVLIAAIVGSSADANFDSEDRATWAKTSPSNARIRGTINQSNFRLKVGAMVSDFCQIAASIGPGRSAVELHKALSRTGRG